MVVEQKISDSQRKHWNTEKESKNNFYIPGESRRHVTVRNIFSIGYAAFIIYLRLLCKQDLQMM